MTAAARPERPAKPRRGRPGYDRQTLVRICVEVFNVHGYEATSMGMLAQQLGISKSAIYHHVQSKEEILELAVDHALDALEAVLEAASAEEDDAAVRIRRALEGTVRVLVEQMPSVTLLLRLRGNSEVEKHALERRRRVTHQVADLMALGQREGSVRQDISAGHLARLSLGTVNSLVDWYRPDAEGAQQSLEQMVQTVSEFVRGGVRAQA